MKRDEYLADEHVRGFTRWAAQLVTGELGLTHRWKSGRGTDFECTTLYGALEQYRWPTTTTRWITEQQRDSFGDSASISRTWAPSTAP